MVNVNVQNKLSSHIDKSADVPGIKELVNTVINVPIDKTTESTMKYSQKFADQWNAYAKHTKMQKLKLIL